MLYVYKQCLWVSAMCGELWGQLSKGLSPSGMGSGDQTQIIRPPPASSSDPLHQPQNPFLTVKAALMAGGGGEGPPPGCWRLRYLCVLTCPSDVQELVSPSLNLMSSHPCQMLWYSHGSFPFVCRLSKCLRLHPEPACVWRQTTERVSWDNGYLFAGNSWARVLGAERGILFLSWAFL